MGLTKRIWIEKDSTHEEFRQTQMKSLSKKNEKYKHRVLRRRPSIGRAWQFSLERAIRQLGCDIIRINGGVFFQTEKGRDAVLSRTKRILKDSFGIEGGEQ